MISRNATRTITASLLCVAAGCSAGAPSPTPGLGSGAGAGIPTNAGTGASGGSAGTIPTNGGSVPVGGSGVADPNDTRDLPIRQQTCDAMGRCTCLRLGLLGTLDSAADETDTQPFIDWLNSNSGGTAVVTMVATKPALDAAFLANYDVLVVANVNTWSFSADEKAAVETWVRETGGGIIALTGFLSTDTEMAATSQLIEFAGFRYQAPKTSENGQSVPVYYDSGTTNLKDCLAWSGNNTAIITTPVHFTPLTGSLEKLTFELDYVGAFIGWSVGVPPGATTVATDPVSGQPIAVALEVDGKGRVYVFGDEWVIFANQWLASGSPYNVNQDMYNPCWDAAGAFFHSAQTLYQTKQFWYDAISWVAPPSECGFTVTDPEVVVR
jgi:hypothetical protein